MAGLLDYCLLICAATAGVSGGYLDPQGVPSHPGVRCILLYPKHMWCRWLPWDGAPANTSLRLWYRMKGAPEVEECKDYVTAGPNSCYFSRENFCLYLTYEIWVEAEGWASERLLVNTGDIAKTDPPQGVTASGQGTYLSVDWRYPPGIAPSYFPLLFQLRYRELGSGAWVHEPDVGEQTSYHIYDVRPDTTYVLMVRCKSAEGNGFWSEWSTPASVTSGTTGTRSENTHPTAAGPALVLAPLPTPGTAGTTTANFTEHYTEKTTKG